MGKKFWLIRSSAGRWLKFDQEYIFIKDQIRIVSKWFNVDFNTLITYCPITWLYYREVLSCITINGKEFYNLVNLLLFCNLFISLLTNTTISWLLVDEPFFICFYFFMFGEQWNHFILFFLKSIFSCNMISNLH